MRLEEQSFRKWMVLIGVATLIVAII